MKKLSLTIVALAIFAVLGTGNVALAKSKKHMMMTKNPCTKGHQVMSGGGKVPMKGSAGGPVCGG